MSSSSSSTTTTWVPRHNSAPSVDTNASAIAESTISLGQIRKFPDPPDSIPSSPAASSFSASGSSARQLPIPPRFPHLLPTAPLQPRKLPYPPTSFVHSRPQNNSILVSAHDWHDGASTIDSGSATEHGPNGLSTSFITSLLQENKLKRASSATTLALSGISESPYFQPSSATYRSPCNTYPASASLTSAFIDPCYLPTSVPSLTGRPSSAMTTVRSKSFASSKTSQSADGLLEKTASATCQSDLGNKELNSAEARQPHFLTQDPMVSRHPAAGSKSPPISARSSKSFISRISKGLSLRHVFVRKTKPLPPIPILPNISLAQQQTYHELEMSSALPDLINRATTLRTMLENGQRPHSSAGSFYVVNSQDTSFHINNPQDPNGNHGTETFIRSKSNSSWYQKFQRAYASPTWALKSKRKWLIISVLLTLSIIALVLGLVLGLRKHQQTSCPEGNVGSTCNINANCVCTSTGQCNGLAQAVIDLLPSVNSAFDANYTAALAYSSFFLTEGGSQNNCGAQTLILDVGNNLDQTKFPNRTQWARTALLWNALKTQDLAAALQLQKFVQSLPWSTLTGSDGPVNNAESTSFSITVSGYTFNFASQAVTLPPGTFVTLGQPSDAEIQKVSPTAMAALDRMYTYAQASSIQQRTALQKYWTSVLLQRADTLPIFKAALSASPVMLPFNASSQEIPALYQSTSSPFPPPVSCFPDLVPTFQQQVSTFETTVFGLPSVNNSQAGFDASCYRDHPIYGVLDVLQLRLPFPVGVSNVAQHAAALNRNSSSRVVLSVGKSFSGIFNGTVGLTTAQLDSRQYGTVNFLDHVVLQYLTSIGDINVANTLIKFVLDSSTAVRPVPPDVSSSLYQAMKTLPSIEIAVLGDITPADFSSVVSPFTISSGTLFFGSDNGAALRNWTISTLHLSIVWAQNATSSLVVRDGSLGNNPVTQTWNSIALALNSRVTNIGLGNITDALMGSFSP